jgi:hypothetical protein
MLLYAMCCMHFCELCCNLSMCYTAQHNGRVLCLLCHAVYCVLLSICVCCHHLCVLPLCCVLCAFPFSSFVCLLCHAVLCHSGAVPYVSCGLHHLCVLPLCCVLCAFPFLLYLCSGCVLLSVCTVPCFKLCFDLCSAKYDKCTVRYAVRYCVVMLPCLCAGSVCSAICLLRAVYCVFVPCLCAVLCQSCTLCWYAVL